MAHIATLHKYSVERLLVLRFLFLFPVCFYSRTVVEGTKSPSSTPGLPPAQRSPRDGSANDAASSLACPPVVTGAPPSYPKAETTHPIETFDGDTASEIKSPPARPLEPRQRSGDELLFLEITQERGSIHATPWSRLSTHTSSSPGEKTSHRQKLVNVEGQQRHVVSRSDRKVSPRRKKGEVVRPGVGQYQPTQTSQQVSHVYRSSTKYAVDWNLHKEYSGAAFEGLAVAGQILGLATDFDGTMVAGRAEPNSALASGLCGASVASPSGINNPQQVTRQERQHEHKGRNRTSTQEHRMQHDIDPPETQCLRHSCSRSSPPSTNDSSSASNCPTKSDGSSDSGESAFVDTSVTLWALARKYAKNVQEYDETLQSASEAYFNGLNSIYTQSRLLKLYGDHHRKSDSMAAVSEATDLLREGNGGDWISTVESLLPGHQLDVRKVLLEELIATLDEYEEKMVNTPETLKLLRGIPRASIETEVLEVPNSIDLFKPDALQTVTHLAALNIPVTVISHSWSSALITATIRHGLSSAVERCTFKESATEGAFSQPTFEDDSDRSYAAEATIGNLPDLSTTSRMDADCASEWVRSVLSAVEVPGNELVFRGGISTGFVRCRCVTPRDKRDLLQKMREKRLKVLREDISSSDQDSQAADPSSPASARMQQRERPPQKAPVYRSRQKCVLPSASPERETRLWVIYVGDTIADIAALLEADIGILMGEPSERMHAVLQAAAVVVQPLSTLIEEFQEQAVKRRKQRPNELSAEHSESEAAAKETLSVDPEEPHIKPMYKRSSIVDKIVGRCWLQEAAQKPSTQEYTLRLPRGQRSTENMIPPYVLPRASQSDSDSQKRLQNHVIYSAVDWRDVRRLLFGYPP